MGLKNDVLNLGRFFSGRSKAFDREVEEVVQAPKNIQLVDTRPNFIKKRDQRLTNIRKQREDEDLMLFARMVQKQDLNQPL